jgi:hypothetical protein
VDCGHYYINGNCALFTYFDTTLAVPKQQFFGYKLDTTTGIIYSYQADTKIDCATTTTWEAMNNPTEIKYSVSALDSFFSSPSNPKLIEIHLIAENLQLKTGGVPVRRDILVQVFIRNN